MPGSGLDANKGELFMARKNTKVNESTVVGIDVGTTKVAAMIASVGSECPELLGVATVPIDYSLSERNVKFLFAIKGAVKEACKNSGYQPQTAFIGISGFAESCIVASEAEIEGRVTKNDIHCLLEATAARSDIPEYLVMLEQIAKPFYINRNEKEGIDNPHGMEAECLEVMSHNILCCKAMVKSMAAAANKLPGIISFRVTSSELAAAEVLLTREDKQNGVCLLDIGGECASLVIYHAGVLKHTASVPWGGNRLNDRIKFRIGKNAAKAEQAKLSYSQGAYDSNANEQDKMIHKLMGNELLVLCSHLDTELCKSELEEDLKSGIVLIGGTAKLSGLADTIEKVMQMPVRMGQFTDQKWLEDIPLGYANAAGLIMQGSGSFRGQAIL
jgi:cell division protein FtsA